MSPGHATERSRDLAIRRGRTVARLLTGAWRAVPPPLSLDHLRDVRPVVPLLVRHGSAPMVWHRLRGTASLPSAHAVDLQHVYKGEVLFAAVRERQLGAAIRGLDAEGIDALVLKGWAAGRYYAEPALRPYEDIDLGIQATRHARAASTLAPLQGKPARFDLHPEFPRSPTLTDRDLGVLRARSRRAVLDDLDVSVLAPEDHLHTAAVHMLRHGAWRPMWLADIAAILEACGARLDWHVCLGTHPRVARWMACTIGLAKELLGAEVSAPPGAVAPVPSWLKEAVLEEWGTLDSCRRRSFAGDADLEGVSLDALASRWPPNPIAATVAMGAPFNDLPRLPFQVGYASLRLGGEVVRRLRFR